MSNRDEEPTAKVLTHTATSIVVVAASGQRLAGQLKAALTGSSIIVEASGSTARLTTLLEGEPPVLVIVDATDYPAIEPDVLAAALAGPPATTVRAIWGADLIYGTRVRDALAAAGTACSPFQRSDGIDPLVDLVRARTAK